MTNDYIQQQYDYFEKNIVDLSKKYNNKFIVIKNFEVIGSYNTFELALEETIKKHKPGSFIIQQCSEKIETQMFHSRVFFPLNGQAN